MKNKLKIAQNSSLDAESPQTPGRIVFGSSGLTCLDPEISPQKLAGMVTNMILKSCDIIQMDIEICNLIILKYVINVNILCNVINMIAF